MQFGQKLIQLREKRGLSQEQLADELQVSRQTISDWENDAAVIDVENAANICRYFGVDMNALFLDPTDLSADLSQNDTPASATDVPANGSVTTDSAPAKPSQDSDKNSLAIWRTSLVVSVILFAVFFAVAVIAATLLVFDPNSGLTINSMIFVIVGLAFAGIAALMALVMLIVSTVMFVKCRKSLATKYQADSADKK